MRVSDRRGLHQGVRQVQWSSPLGRVSAFPRKTYSSARPALQRLRNLFQLCILKRTGECRFRRRAAARTLPLQSCRKRSTEMPVQSGNSQVQPLGNFAVVKVHLSQVDHTESQGEVGLRYHEGAAAGAVMIGETPDCGELFRPQTLLSGQQDGYGTMDVLNELRPGTDGHDRQAKHGGSAAASRLAPLVERIVPIASIEPSPRNAACEQPFKDMADLCTCAD